MKALYTLLLLRPDVVAARLAEAERAGLCRPAPNLWQLSLGVLRMWQRILFRSETIGLSREHRLRPGWRARLLASRPLRFPFLLAERAIAPWDLTGLLSSRERLLRHLLGAHHDEDEFVYDLELLRCHPGALEELEAQARAVVTGASPRAAWLRDLVVFEGYHERLLAAVRAELAGRPIALDDPDYSFAAYLAWCAAQPSTPSESVRGFFTSRKEGGKDLGRSHFTASPQFDS
jgi:hypothetical protein